MKFLFGRSEVSRLVTAETLRHNIFVSKYTGSRSAVLWLVTAKTLRHDIFVSKYTGRALIYWEVVGGLIKQ